MKTELSDGQKAELRGMIESPLLSLAMTEALREVHEEKKSAVTLEEAAMAYSTQAGATRVLAVLFGMAESKQPSIGISPRKLRHN
jgi:hypothetical protein